MADNQSSDTQPQDVELQPTPIPQEQQQTDQEVVNDNNNNNTSNDTQAPTTSSIPEKNNTHTSQEQPQISASSNSPSAILDTPVNSELQKLSPQEAQVLLFEYIIAGKLNEFKELLVAQLEMHIEENVDNLFRDNESQATLMHKAARYNSIDILDMLTHVGANLEALDFMDATPLMYSAASGSSKACHYLLSKCAQTNLRDKFQMSPLILAMKNGHFETAQILLVGGADMHFKGPRGSTPLHLACEEGNLEKVKFLLDNGAVITRTNQKSQSCLFTALKNQPTFQFLIEYMKRETGIKSVFKQLLTRDDQTRTVLHICVEYEYAETLQYLIDFLKQESLPLHKELLNEKEQLFGNTPLHVAVNTNKFPLVQKLCGTNVVDVNAQSNNGNTPLHLAIDNKNQLLAQYLTFVQKSNTKVKNNNKLTALQMAKNNKIDLTVFSMADQCGVDPKAYANATTKVAFCGCFGA